LRCRIAILVSAGVAISYLERRTFPLAVRAILEAGALFGDSLAPRW
jgi:hypothetical protein